jgi:hypothetical protein
MLMNELCRAEVYAFHRFLTKWYAGRGQPDKLLFSEFTDVLDRDFALVTPYGRTIGRAELVDAVWRAYGAHASSARPFKVWVERFDGRILSDNLHLGTYEEWQWVDARTRVRQTTAIFRKSEQARHGVEWVHVHETWLVPSKTAVERPASGE